MIFIDRFSSLRTVIKTDKEIIICGHSNSGGDLYDEIFDISQYVIITNDKYHEVYKLN